jgi:hypothetical protein
MKRGIGLLMVALGLAGCASLQAAQRRSTEQLLAEAGFEIRTADTPDARAYLDTLPAGKMLTRSESGQTEYAYADSAGCTCLYVGTEQQYQEFRKLQQAQAAAIGQRRDAEIQDAFYGLWGGIWPPPLR